MKISFCITCMGRLHHLQQTLPENLKFIGPNVELVVLNYGSQDGLHDWMRQFSSEFGNLNYFHTSVPVYFCATHAKNIVHRVATGDILCNLDADNFLISGYVEYLLEAFKKSVIVASESQDISGHDGCCGKIALRKEHFYAVNGYDEDQYLGWGCDDTSLQYRARMQNNLELVMCPIHFNRAIPHDNAERVKHYLESDIGRSQADSWARLRKLAETYDYIANKNRPWGVAELEKNFTEQVSLK